MCHGCALLFGVKRIENLGSKNVDFSNSILLKWNGSQAKQTCWWHATVSVPLSCTSFFCSDRWCGQLENFGEGHNSQDVMEPPCLHLYWLSVSASETTLHWASLITHYINFIQCVSLFPRPNSALHPLMKQVQGSNGCAVRLLSDLQHMRGLETHSYIFSAYYLTEYGLSWEMQSLSSSLALRMILASLCQINYVDHKLCTAHPTAVTYNYDC